MAIPKQSVGIRQSKSELMVFRVDGVASTAVILEGKYHATLTDHGAGDYTLTFARPAARVLCVVGAVAETANLMPQIVSATSSAVRIKWVDNDGTPTATDAVFHLSVLAYYDATQR